MPTLSTQNLAVGYNGTAILSHINIALDKNNMAVLIGANGSGKSTLMRTIAGVLPPVAGTVELEGQNIANLSRRRMARRMSVVTTGRGGGGALSVEECVAIGRNPYTGITGRLSQGDKDIVARAIHDVGLDEKRHSFLAALSDGERQKAMIARALAQQTPVIMLDEPTAFLDVAGRRDIIALLRKLADAGATIIISTHDIAPAIAAADTIIAIDKKNKTIFTGDKNSIISSGTLDYIFAGMHFDPTACDFR